MKIATFNVNGINGRLAGPAALARRGAAGRRLPAGTQGAAREFPDGAIRNAGYGAIWQGQKSWNGVAILARGDEPIETRRGLPGDPDDTHSRYIEAAVNGLLIGCLYLPNGNPAPGPSSTTSCGWFERLAAHAATLLASGAPGRARRRLQRDADRSRRLQARAMGRRRAVPARGPRRLPPPGRTGLDRRVCERCTPTSASIRSGTISGTPMRATPGCASTICC